MQDRFGRETKGIRISVTQRCNLDCFYCHKEGQNPSKKEMTPSEIERIVFIGKKIGIKQLKITGGEPLVRRDICEIVQRASNHMKNISMTTNGILLEKYAADLKSAGLRRVNISFDTLDAEKYKIITGTDCLSKVVDGLNAAIANDLTPIKLNMVIMKGINEDEIEEMIRFASEKRVILQLIELEMFNKEFYDKYHYDIGPIVAELEERSVRVEEREMHHRRKYFIEIDGNISEVEVVKPMHNTTFCSNCTRMRVTADGKLKPCLLRSNNLVDLIGLIRKNASDEELIKTFKKAILLREPFWR
ncbi:MAG: GTP 3',8-cyclase MoaA [Methanocellales archaeon]|nr:GTP 3',8-cyclase MoaA [Methanocellales archaeon]MDD3291695.1 GTP 3',8-cyclase MoaA [Methanocellales archaeon]MDD5235045.1 GTP 3',8-cyclase MoaA [Methanocellales archaeon]MDD5485183.1 GTP 3',8-cyclase MoaA [Methanocellales archaeon]